MADKTPPVKTRVESVLEEPSAMAVARVYADAFLAAQPVGKAEESLSEFASFIEDVLQANPQFASLLNSGMVGRDEKIALIGKVLEGRATPLFVDFLKVLAKHERLDLLPLISRLSQRRHEERSGFQRVQVTSSQPLTAAQLQAVEQGLASSLPFKPIVEAKVDPALIGGLKIRVGDTVYDSSLQARMQQLRVRMRERGLHEIQSGRSRFSHSEGN